MNLRLYAKQYHQDLLEHIVPFWVNFGWDEGNGGYICVLSAKGEVVSTDKWIGWYAEQAWVFAQLYQAEARPEFLKYARHGADFLLHFAADSKDNYWQVVDCTGRGVEVATDACPESLSIMAWCSLYEITQEEQYADAAKKTLLKTFRRREKRLQKQVDDLFSGRSLKNLTELSALAKALLAAKELISEKLFREKSEDLINELMKHFWEPRANILLEIVFIQGGYSDCILGRRIHPGKVFEAFNVFYELTKQLNKRQLRRQLAQHVVYLADTTWDEGYGGYFYWLDLKSLPITEPKAYFKYAWVHLEASTALLHAYEVLQESTILKQWQRLHDYLWQYFPDKSPEGEWIGILSRHGEPLFHLKATPQKSAYYPVKNLLKGVEIMLSLSSSPL